MTQQSAEYDHNPERDPGARPDHQPGSFLDRRDRRPRSDCHPFDEVCGGPGGPCRNHGGLVIPPSETP